MVLALDRNQQIAVQVFAGHVPGLVTEIAEAANAKALTLSHGVVHQSLVAADHLAFRGFDVAGLGWQVLLQEISELALTNKADAG